METTFIYMLGRLIYFSLGLFYYLRLGSPKSLLPLRFYFVLSSHPTHRKPREV